MNQSDGPGSVGQSADLRTRIAAVVYRHTLFRALDQCECGAAFDGFSGRSLDAYAAHVADAVIQELCMHRQEMSEWDVLANGFRGHRYVTHWEENDE